MSECYGRLGAVEPLIVEVKIVLMTIKEASNIGLENITPERVRLTIIQTITLQNCSLFGMHLWLDWFANILLKKIIVIIEKER
jgi:hypothetical protein